MKALTRKQAKQDSYQRILESACLILKVKGIKETSIGDVMTGAGLTHGSFYAHFKDKNDLVLKASRHMIDQANAAVVNQLNSSQIESEKWFRAFLEFYLSPQHVKNVADGCPVAAMAREIGKAKTGLRRSFADLLSKTVEERRRLLATDRDPIERSEWIGIMSTYVGALILSRACQGEPISEEILKASKAFLYTRGKQ